MLIFGAFMLSNTSNIIWYKNPEDQHLNSVSKDEGLKVNCTSICVMLITNYVEQNI